MTDDARTRETLALIVEAALSGTLPPETAARHLLLTARDYLDLGDRMEALRLVNLVPVEAWVWFALTPRSNDGVWAACRALSDELGGLVVHHCGELPRTEARA